MTKRLNKVSAGIQEIYVPGGLLNASCRPSAEISLHPAYVASQEVDTKYAEILE